MSVEAPRTLTLRPVHEQWPAVGWPPDENDLSVVYRELPVLPSRGVASPLLARAG